MLLKLKSLVIIPYKTPVAFSDDNIKMVVGISGENNIC